MSKCDKFNRLYLGISLKVRTAIDQTLVKTAIGIIILIVFKS